MLWDCERATIVNNESADVLRMLGTVFAPLAEHPVELYPRALAPADRRAQPAEHLWPYLRDLYQWPGVAETVDFDEIRAHYYGTHPMINPQLKIALMPALDFSAPPGRESL